jgi:sugar lactone lactonase YvrE
MYPQPRLPTCLMVGLLATLGACADPCGEAGTTCTVLGTGAAGFDLNEPDALRSPVYAPMDVAVRDGASNEFFVADWNNHVIKHVLDDTVEIIVGTDFTGDGDLPNNERVSPGVPGTDVSLNHPTSLEWNPVTGRLLLPSWHNHRVREWNPETGNSLVVASNTAFDDGNGANAGFAGDGGPAADALMAFPNSITIDPSDGSFWLLPQRNGRIRKVAADYSLIQSVAGNGLEGYTGDGGPALEASFLFWPYADLQPEPGGAIEYDGEALIYIADTSNHVIRVFDTVAGTIDTLDGTGTQTMAGGACDKEALCYPRDVELGPDGRLWVADAGNHVIRVIDLDTGEMSTAVGTFSAGNGEDGLPPLETALDRPHGIDLADDGSVLIADTYNHRIRKVNP